MSTNMNQRESEHVSDHHEYIENILSHTNMYEQGIDTIRPPERSGNNTPARKFSSTSSPLRKLVPPRLQTLAPQPQIVNANVPSHVSDHHEYIENILSHTNMYEQGIDTIRPPKRSGNNTPARKFSSTSSPLRKLVPPRLQTRAPQPQIVNANVPSRLQTPALQPQIVNANVPSRLQTPAPQLQIVNAYVPHLTSSPPLPYVVQADRPSFLVDVVIGFKKIGVDLRKCVKTVISQILNVARELEQFGLFLLFLMGPLFLVFLGPAVERIIRSEIAILEGVERHEKEIADVQELEELLFWNQRVKDQIYHKNILFANVTQRSNFKSLS